MWFLILFVLFSQDSSANGETVLSIHSDSLLLLPKRAEGCPVGAAYGILSESKDSPFKGVARLNGEANARGCFAKVEYHSKSLLIRPGDPVVFVDFARRAPHIPGRFDLLQEGKPFAARYKPLIYGGYHFGHTASTLNKGEWLLGLSPLMFGPHDRITLELSPFLALDRVLAYGGKALLYRGEDHRLAIHGELMHFLKQNNSAWNASILFDSVSSSSLSSHTRLKFVSRLPSSLPLMDRNREKKYSVELSTIYEWMLPNWNRLLIGPRFIAGDENDLGLLFAAMFIYERLHWSINLELSSLSKFDIRNYRQVVSAGVYWRL
jgi:hypothetical protein